MFGGGVNVGELKARHDLQGLADALSTKGTRWAVVRAICELNDPQAVVHVVQVDGYTRSQHDDKFEACGAVYSHFGARAIAPLYAFMRGKGSSGGMAPVRLGQAGEQLALPVLLEALRDPEPWLRLDAARGLTEMKSPRATADLVVALRDDDPGVREAAAEALVETRDARCASALAELVTDPYASIRMLVVRSLRLFDAGEWATYWLKRAAEDPDDDVRSLARSELRELGHAPPGEAPVAARAWLRGPAPANPKHQCFCGCGLQLTSKDQKNVSSAARHVVDALDFVTDRAIPYLDAIKRQEAEYVGADGTGAAGRVADIDGPIDQLIDLARRGDGLCAHYAEAVHAGWSMKQIDRSRVKPFMQEAGEWKVEIIKKLARSFLNLEDFDKLGPDRVVDIVQGRLTTADEEVKRLRKG